MVAVATTVGCLLLGQIAPSSLYVTRNVPTLPASYQTTMKPLRAGEDFQDDLTPLADLLSNPDILMPLPEQRPSNSRVQVLDDDDIDVPSPGQKRAIRRMSHIDFSRWQMAEGDVGGTAVQIARLSARINGLSRHLAENRHDVVAMRRISVLTSDRRKLLNYLWKRDPGVVVDLIQELNIRWRRPKLNTLIPRSGPVDIPIPRQVTRPRTIPKANQAAAAAAAAGAE
eukprot:EG_transcript_22249